MQFLLHFEAQPFSALALTTTTTLSTRGYVAPFSLNFLSFDRQSLCVSILRVAKYMILIRLEQLGRAMRKCNQGFEEK